MARNVVLSKLVWRGEETFFCEERAKCDLVVKGGSRIAAAI